MSRWSDDSDDDAEYFCQYKLTPTASSLEVISAWRNMLAPMLDAYYYAAHLLQKLIATQMTDKEFIHSTRSYIESLLEKGILKYGKKIKIFMYVSLRPNSFLFQFFWSFKSKFKAHMEYYIRY